MSNLGNRLAKIEHDRQPTGVAVVWMNASESTDAAIARYLAEHKSRTLALTRRWWSI